MPRTARIDRKTAETEISLELNLDGSGQANIATGVGFFDHMLTLLAKHAAIDLSIDAKGTCTSISTTPSRTSASASAQALQPGLGRQGGHSPLRPFHAADGRNAGHDRPSI